MKEMARFFKNLLWDVWFLFDQFTNDRITQTQYLLHFLMYFRCFNEIIVRKKMGRIGKNFDIRPNVNLGGTKNIFIGDNICLRHECSLHASNSTDKEIATITIEDDVLFGPYVLITVSSHIYDSVDVPIMEQGLILKDVRIKKGAWLGARCIILPGVTVGEGAIVGAGAVVTRDVPDYAIAVGVPARILKMRPGYEKLTHNDK
jgi:acetyltransferase-like isoleucine patch superfamily enzyme